MATKIQVSELTLDGTKPRVELRLAQTVGVDTANLSDAVIDAEASATAAEASAQEAADAIVTINTLVDNSHNKLRPIVLPYTFTNAVGQSVFTVYSYPEDVIVVTLNGLQKVAGTDFTTDSVADTLTLTTPLALTTDVLQVEVFGAFDSYIDHTEFSNVAGQQVFSISYDTQDYLRVVKNGAQILDTEYDRVPGGIDMRTPFASPTDTLSITVYGSQDIDGGFF